MKLRCLLTGHRRERDYEFIRRSDGYPVAAYKTCQRCGARLDFAQ